MKPDAFFSDVPLPLVGEQFRERIGGRPLKRPSITQPG
jgi:hypothetical protein